MNTPAASVCPRCGGRLLPDAPKGLCPRCLGAMNLAPETQFTDVGFVVTAALYRTRAKVEEQAARTAEQRARDATGTAQHIEFKVLRVENPPGTRTLLLHFERDANPGPGFEVGMDAKPAPGGQLPEFADVFWLRTSWVGAGDARVLNWTLPEPFTPDEARAAAARIEKELPAQRDAWSRLSGGAVPKVGSVRHRDGWSCELFFRVKREAEGDSRLKGAAASPITSSIAASDNSPEAIAAAQQRGIASATRDIQAGVLRILRYGVLMRTDGTETDEETGFRIQWVAGSILSSQFQAEADAYNFAMREHYQKHVRWQRKAATAAQEPQGPYPVAARSTNVATGEGEYKLASGATLVITAKPSPRGAGAKHFDGRLDWPKSATGPKAESFDVALSEGAPFAVGWRADGQVLWVACGGNIGTHETGRFIRKLTLNSPGDVDEQSWDAREKHDFGGLPAELRRVFDAFIAPATKPDSAAELMEKAIQLARQRVGHLRATMAAGRASQFDLIEAEGALALAEARDNRVKQAEASLTTAARLLELVETLRGAGRASEEMVLLARQRKLTAEPELQRQREALLSPATNAPPATGRKF